MTDFLTDYGIIVALVCALAAVVYGLAVPVRKWMAEAPQHFEAAVARLERLREPVRKVQEVATRIEQAAQGPATTGPATTSTSTDSANSTGDSA